MISLFRKKTREELINKRVENVLIELTSDIECSFTELEQVQILNEVRRRFVEKLEVQKSECLSKSTDLQVKAKEISNAIDYLN